MSTGKNIALTRRTFVGKVMSLLFNKLSKSVITFLPSSKHLLMPWLQSPSTVILEPPKIKSVTVSIVILFAMTWWDRMPWFLEWAFALPILKLFSFKEVCHYRLWPRSEIWLQDVVTDSSGSGYQGLPAVLRKGRWMSHKQVTHICLSERSSLVLFQMQWPKVSQFVKYLPQRKYISKDMLSRNWAAFGKA